MKTFLRIIAACCVMALTALTVFGVRGKTLCITHRFSVV